MGHCGELVETWMTVFAYDFASVDAYVAFGCDVADDTLLLNVSGWKVVREF